MLQNFDPTRFTLRQDRPNGTQAPEPKPQVSDPILREQVLKSFEEKNK